jgi:hypothetical protein
MTSKPFYMPAQERFSLNFTSTGNIFSRQEKISNNWFFFYSFSYFHLKFYDILSGRVLGGISVTRLLFLASALSS